MDGLKGLEEAIQTVFPQAKTQRCIIHLIRNAIKYVSAKERKICAGLKEIYHARQLAQTAFDKLKSQWDVDMYIVLKLKGADPGYVIVNDTSLEQTEQLYETIAQWIKK